jgi:TonB-dependent receptor
MKIPLRDAIGTALGVCTALVATHPASVIAQEAPPNAAEPVSLAAQGVTEEVVVTARQRSAATDVMQERLEHEVVVDLLGAEQISRVGDSTVSLALRRLPGVTLVSDKFIYVRGLGERYSSTTVNGAYVPSPDLTRNVVPLDLFPAEIIDSLVVNKGFTADMPAAFGGGSVDIRTTGIPDELVFDFQIGSGWNTQNSGRALTYRGGSDDWLGTDDGTRELPREIRDAIEEYQGNLTPVGILNGLNRDGEAHTLAEAQQINRELATSLYRDVDFTEGSSDPDVSAEVALGNSWYFGEGERWRAGFLALADYGNQWRDRERTNRSALDPGTVSDTRVTTQNVSLTGSLNLGLEYGKDHKIEVTGLYLRNTEDEAQLSTGHNFNFRRDEGRQLRTYRIRFEERELELLQLRGSHTLGEDTVEWLGPLGEFLSNGLTEQLNYSWYYSDATAMTDIPSEITLSAEDSLDPASGAVLSTALRQSASAAEYRYTDLRDEVKSYGWSLSKPFTWGAWAITLSGGADYYQKGRRYLQTQLNLGANNGEALAGSPGSVLTEENIMDPASGFSLSLGGIGTESYLAAESIDAAYGKIDVNWNDRWRITGGVRWEDFKQLAVPVDQYQYDVDVPKIPIPVEELPSLVTIEDDYYPSVALTYMAQDFLAPEFQLRFGWSRTATRPDLREVSPATYIDPFTDARVRGNPDLLTSDLEHFDVRAQWLFEGGDSVTVSGFYKEIADPIETVESAGTDDDIALTFINAESAEVYGLELEWLKGLGFLADHLGNWAHSFFVSGNATWSESELVVGEQALNLTHRKRPLTQHSEYVANVQLGFDAPNRAHSASLVYNMFSERIFFAGRNGAPDAYEQPFHSLDLVYSFYPTETLSLRLRAQNLLEETIEVKRDEAVVLEQEIGMTFRLDATMRF